MVRLTPESNDQRRVVAKFLAIDLGVGVQEGENAAVAGVGDDLGLGELGGERRHHGFLDRVDPRAREAADGDRARVLRLENLRDRGIGDAIDLVEDEDRRLLATLQFLQDGVDGADVLLGLGVRGVDDVEQELGGAGLGAWP